MKMRKIWWPFWLLFIGFWLMVYWPIAIVLFFIKLIADHFLAEWAGTLLAFSGLISIITAALTIVDTVRTTPNDIVTIILMTLFAVLSGYITFLGWNRIKIGKVLGRYAKVVYARQKLSVYDLANEIKEPDIYKIKTNLELLIRSSRLPSYCYDRETMRIDVNAKDTSLESGKLRTVVFNCSACGATNQILTAEDEVACEYCDTANYVS